MALVSGANVNFERLGHVVERCALGDGSEALLSVTIPERPGSFLDFCKALEGSSITEFNYRYSSDRNARVFVGIKLQESSKVLQQRLVQRPTIIFSPMWSPCRERAKAIASKLLLVVPSAGAATRGMERPPLIASLQ